MQNSKATPAEVLHSKLNRVASKRLQLARKERSLRRKIARNKKGS